MIKTVFRAMLSILSLVFCISTFAQTPTPGGPPAPVSNGIFSFDTEAVGIHVGGQTVAGTDAIGSLKLKNSWYLQSDNLLFSSACSSCQAVSGQLYVGGVKYYSSYLANVLNANGLQGLTPYFHSGIGIYRNSPGDGSAKNHFGALVSGGADYNINGTFSIGPRVGLVVAPGAGPTCSAAPCPKQGPLGYFISADLKFNIAKIVH